MQRFTRGLHFKPDGSVLCIFQNKWNLYVPPGGVIEFGETPEEAVKRECKEEMGITLLKVHLVHEGEFPFTALGGDKPDIWYGYIYLIIAFSGEIQIREPTKHRDWGYKKSPEIHPKYRSIAENTFLTHKCCKIFG